MIIRKGTEADLEAVHALVRELALFEKAPEEVITSPEEYARDGFGERSFFEFFVAEDTKDGVVGIAFFYFGYSTWKGKILYLDDLVITENWRRKGIGGLLLDRLVHFAKEHRAKQVRWQVLDWNEPAIKMYRKVGANLDEEWINCKLEQADIDRWTTSSL
ncbi:MAG: GNAT family N-acetyltransferase [Bacteroidota bacterium]